MQVKKDEIKNKLLESAEEEFLEKGFDKASIRTIVKNAGTTIGNFYNYFKSKEQVFESLVGEFYAEFKRFISYHQAEQVRSEMLMGQDIDVWRAALSQLISPLMPMLNNRLLLLLEYSGGTKFEDAKSELTGILIEHFEEHIKEYAPDYPHVIMGDIISRQIIAAIVEIIKSGREMKEKEQLITEETLFCAIGVMGLLKGDINDIYTKP